MNALRHFKNVIIEFINEQGYLDTVLAQGAEKASQVAEQTLAVVRDKIGLLPRR